MLIPLATFILLGSIHLVFLTATSVYNEYRTFAQSELVGFLCIIAASAISVAFAGAEEEMAVEEFDSIFNVTYFVWMLGSLFANMSLRKMGYYAGRIFIETSIPAQIYVWGLGFLKIGFLAAYSYINEYTTAQSTIWLSFGVGVVAFLISNPFFNKLVEISEVNEVYSGYYVWLVSYGLPLGVCVINAGTHYTTYNLIALVISVVLNGLGVYMISYHENTSSQEMRYIGKGSEGLDTINTY